MVHGFKPNRLKVVAEGVQTKGQFEILQKIGCDEIQGFYLNHIPLPQGKIRKVLQDNANALRSTV